MSLGKVGFIGRFKPLHLGASALLESLCENADAVIIGVGSSNKYNLRNPFTAEESENMIDIFLSPRFSNYTTIQIPDFGHIPEYADGKKWKEYIVEKFGKLDHFISGNGYVRSLLKDEYPMMYPFDTVPKENQVRLRATEVRMEMAKDGDWKKLVPEKVAQYLESKGIAERFRKEFGSETLKAYSTKDCHSIESMEQERIHALEA